MTNVNHRKNAFYSCFICHTKFQDQFQWGYELSNHINDIIWKVYKDNEDSLLGNFSPCIFFVILLFLCDFWAKYGHFYQWWNRKNSNEDFEFFRSNFRSNETILSYNADIFWGKVQLINFDHIKHFKLLDCVILHNLVYFFGFGQVWYVDPNKNNCFHI